MKNKPTIPKFKTLGEQAAYAMFEEAILYAVANDPKGPITIEMMSSLWHRDKDSWINRLDHACDMFARADKTLITRACTKARGDTLDEFVAAFWIEMLTIVRMHNNV